MNKTVVPSKRLPSSKKQVLTLHDEVILEFVKIFQKGIIEQTDVTELFRQLKLTVDKNNKIVLSK